MIMLGQKRISSIYYKNKKIDTIYQGLIKVYSSGVYFSYTGNWIVDKNIFTSNKIDHGQSTVERIIFKNAKGYKIKLTYDQSSESRYDYGIFSKIDQNVTAFRTDPNNYASAYGETTGTVIYPAIEDNNEHYIELMYRKDPSTSYGRDNIIVTLEFIK